ncbi:MAG: amino acid-binding protein [Eggerthellaceae bacterium]|nr:amino acid-binding protein [Eggerthellaceae bacterium]
MIMQLTVFLQNEKGRLASATRTLAEAGINMHALFIADTQDFGIVRIFCDTPDEAAKALAEAGFRASLTPVVAVRVANEAGGLSKLLEFCDTQDMNIEYAYCFCVNNEAAVNVLKIEGEGVEAKLIEGGFATVSPEEIYAA